MKALIVYAGAFLLTTAFVRGQDWPNWRGPNHNGTTTASDLTVDFGPKKRVRWSVKLPGPGASTPIVVGDRVFLTSVDTKRDRLVALCVSRSKGEVLWQRDAGGDYLPEGLTNKTYKGRRSNYASPSPATDGERVVFFFGNGDLVAYDFDGEEVWRRNLQEDYGEFSFMWTFSASPLIWDGKLYMPVLQRDTPARKRGGGGGRRGRRGRRGPSDQEPAEKSDPIESFLLALDAKSGEQLFRHVRPWKAQFESLECYATLVPHQTEGGAKQLLCVGGDVLTGHDPESGKELWRWGTWNEGHREKFWRLVPTVVSGDGVAVVCAPKRAPVYAIKLGGEGELGPEWLAWKSGGRPNFVSSDVPSPAYHDGHFYVLSDVRAALSKVKASDGEVVWTTELNKQFAWRASPTVADGKVFFENHGGQVWVVDASDGEVVHKVHFGFEGDDQIRSSVVVAHDSLFIRTNDELYCVGK